MISRNIAIILPKDFCWLRVIALEFILFCICTHCRNRFVSFFLSLKTALYLSHLGVHCGFEVVLCARRQLSDF